MSEYICLETSSILPLFAFTPYTLSLYKKCNEFTEKGYKFCVYEDSIQELFGIQFISKSKVVLNDLMKYHNSNRLSTIRQILQYFPGNWFGNNSARAVSLFVLDLLDDPQLDNLSFNEFTIKIKDLMSKKVFDLSELLSENPIKAEPKRIFSYWHPDKEELNKFDSFTIDIFPDNGKPISNKNKMRDFFHLQQANQNNRITVFLVADRNFTKQFENDSAFSIKKRDNLEILTLKK